jgi:acetyl esterase/lipase
MNAVKTRAILAAAATIVSASASVTEPVELADFVALARPAPVETLAYGPAPSQAIDVFLPRGDGPHPVAILIHGGCWKDLPGAGREQLRPMGRALADRGIAVWSIGYRRANEAGGGYPGTFEDAASAIDMVRKEAARLRLDLARSAVVGHSAGGHLALWAAVRGRLPANSALRRAVPFIPRSVISLAGVGDLRQFARFVPVLCGPDILERLAPAEAPYTEISPAEMPAPASRVVTISATLDRLVPPYVAHDYAQAM